MLFLVVPAIATAMAATTFVKTVSAVGQQLVLLSARDQVKTRAEQPGPGGVGFGPKVLEIQLPAPLDEWGTLVVTPSEKLALDSLDQLGWNSAGAERALRGIREAQPARRAALG